MSRKRYQVRLLDRKSLIPTGDVDQAAWNYHPILGPVQRARFDIIVGLLGERRYERLLEIGYGSGVFMPELSRHCRNLYGIDPHPMPERIEAVLAESGVSATLSQGGAESLPFDDGFFDAVIAVSSMEYVEEIEQACREIERVLAPRGIFVMITPGHSKILDMAVRFLTGESAAAQYGDRRQRLLDVVNAHFAEVETEVFRLVFTPFVKLYTALKLQPKAKE